MRFLSVLMKYPPWSLVKLVYSLADVEWLDPGTPKVVGSLAREK